MVVISDLISMMNMNAIFHASSLVAIFHIFVSFPTFRDALKIFGRATNALLIFQQFGHETVVLKLLANCEISNHLYVSVVRCMNVNDPQLVSLFVT